MIEVRFWVNYCFVSGFIDAEGCFTVSVFEQRTKWYGYSSFRIRVHTRDLPLLHAIKDFFGGIGSINVEKSANIALVFILKFYKISIIF